MALETEYANIIGPTDVVSNAVADALVQSVVCVPLIYAENLPADTRVKLWRKDGSFAAEELAESTSTSAFGQLTQTSVSATAAKAVSVSKLTVEAIRFREISVASMAAKQGQSIARLLDANIISLISGFSQSVTATSVATPDIWMDALSTIQGSLAAKKGGNLRGILHSKAAGQLRKHLINTSASPFTLQPMLSLLQGYESPNGYVGSLPGIDLFATTGIGTSGGDYLNLCFNPDNAFGGGYDPGVQTEVVFVGSGGVYYEITSYMFNKVVEWVDEGGCIVKSDTGL